VRAQIPGDMSLSADRTQFSVSENLETCRDMLIASFSAQKGTYIYDLGLGFPYQQVLAFKGSEISNVQSVLTQWLLSFSFVKSVNRVSYELTPERELSVSFHVTTIYGEISV
jgi:hypothetical protein